MRKFIFTFIILFHIVGCISSIVYALDGDFVAGSFFIGFFVFSLFCFSFFLFLFHSIKTVEPNNVKIVKFFGKYTHILRPGINFIIPVIEKTRHQDLYRKNMSFSISSISSDNVTVTVGINVVYYIHDDRDDSTNGNIYKSVYLMDDFIRFLESSIDEQLRALISTFTHKEIFSKREEIGNIIENNLRQKLGGFGYSLDSIQVRDISLDPTVTATLDRVVASEKIKEVAFNEGEAEKIKQWEYCYLP